MSTDPTPLGSSGGKPQKKLKLKLKSKSGGKGLKKPSLKLGKSPSKPVALSQEGAVPPAGITQPPIPKADSVDIPANPIPAVPEPTEVPQAPLDSALTPPPAVPSPAAPPVPEGIGEVNPEVESAESLIPPVPSSGDETLPLPDEPALPPVPEPSLEMPPPPVASQEPASLDLPPVPSADTVESNSDEDMEPAESLLPPPPLPGVENALPAAEEPMLPPVPEPAEEAPFSPVPPQEPTSLDLPPVSISADTQVDSNEETETGDGLLPPPPVAGADSSSVEPGPLPAIPEPVLETPSLPPVPESPIDLPPIVPSLEEPVSTESDTDPANEVLPPPPLPGGEESSLPELDISEDEVQPESSPVGLPDPIDTSESESLNLTEPVSEGGVSDATVNEINNKISALGDDLNLHKEESRKEFDGLLEKLNGMPDELKQRDDKIDELRESFENLKTNLSKEIDSLQNSGQADADTPSPSPSVEVDSLQVLSTSGQISWNKNQFVVIAQDEKQGEDSPLDVFISDSEQSALEKIHANMTGQKPIFFLFPNTLESTYHEKY